jgi:AhpD family alkylhydroperoxidase
MHNFPVHTLQSAPESSRPSLEQLEGAFGMIPNIAGAMATSPVLIRSLVELFQQVHGGSFTEQQIQTVLLTNAVTNRCSWAVAFHSYLALQHGVAAEDVDAIRLQRLPASPQDAALSRLARTLIEQRGMLPQPEIDHFIEAGFTPSHLLEVIAIVAASTITNYTGNVTRPVLEPAFAAYA